MKTAFLTHQDGLLQFSTAFFQHCLQSTFSDPTACVHSARYLQTGQAGLGDFKYETGEANRILGFQKYQLQYERKGQPCDRTVIVKSKQPADQVITGIAELLIRCGLEAEGATPAAIGLGLGFANCDLKEIEVYRMQLQQPLFRQYQPELFGLYLDPLNQDYILILECLEQSLLSSNTDLHRWDQQAIEAAVTGMAALHSVWYDKTDALVNGDWLSLPPTANRMTSFLPLWQALFKFSHRYLEDFITKADLVAHLALLEHLPEWWHDLEQMPRTLIQNDFVPKNCTVRPIAAQQRLCVYDWELAISHLPQRDLCEFLCYVLPADVSSEVAQSVVDLHRQTLERLSGFSIDAASWNYGFRLALQDYLINRLSFELVFEEFEPRNIGKLYRTLWRLMEVFPA